MNTFPLSFSTLLPHLRSLTELAGNWVSRTSPDQVLYQKWREALDSAPKMNGTVSPSSMEHTARTFSTAFAAYDRSQKSGGKQKFILNDLNNALELSKAWYNTMEVAGQRGLISRTVLMVNDANLSFIKNVASAVDENTSFAIMSRLDTKNVATAYASANLLVTACTAHGKARDYLSPLVQEDRLDTFRKCQRLLELELATGSYSGTIMLEQKLKDTLVESSRLLSALEPTKAKEFTKESASPSGPTM